MPDQSSVTRADVNMKFYNRFLLLGIAGLAVAGWFFRDGYLQYPLEREVWGAYLELKPDSDGHEEDHSHDHGEGEQDVAIDDPDFPQEEWQALIEERGWQKAVNFIPGEDGQQVAGKPMGKHRSEFDIQVQRYIGAICIPIGLAFLLKVFLARGLWIESDGEQVTSSWGQAFRFDDVIEINKKKWKNKGLAYVKHTGGSTFTIDDLKFKREPTDIILYELEQSVGIDKIVGGRPEEDPREVKAEEEEAETDATPDAASVDATNGQA